MILEGDLEKVIIRFNLLIAVGSPNSLFKLRELFELILEGDLYRKAIIRCNLLIAVGFPNSKCFTKNSGGFDINLILEGDLEQPSLDAICLLQSVPQIQIVSQKNSGGFDINLILEGDLEKPSLDAICLLQSVPQIQIVSQKTQEVLI